ncbi:MAG: XRE family transcriptional regulator [Defluviitaleaceae bacterium]|nr:XRE family transcriptional regulator [Defluviitaleaceae bacterium]
MDIGERIKQLRIKTDLTQEELANRCELSKGFISQLERNLTSPSIATLTDILESLGTNLRDFFNERDNDKIAFGKDDVFLREDQELGHVIRWLIPNAQKNRMEPILITLAPNGRSHAQDPYKGEVFGYVIKGAVLLKVGERKFKLKKGESFYHSANSEYSIENISAYESEVLWVTTPPNF